MICSNIFVENFFNRLALISYRLMLTALAVFLAYSVLLSLSETERFVAGAER